jgi:hypothetical protein
MHFWILYFICLGFGVGSVQLAKVSWVAPIEEIVDREASVIAIPPKPEGARDLKSGEGDEVLYTEAGCLKQSGQFQDICFHQLARQKARTDLEGAIETCHRIQKKDSLWECMADVAELHSLSDREASLNICPSIKRKKWRDQCVFGIALAWSLDDSPWAFRLCDKSGQWRDFCRHDVNGEIAVVNADLALEHCAAEDGDLLTRKTCWHGIGKYIARVDVDAAFNACDRVPSGPDNLYRENCIHGLGWGASEKAEEKFIASCDRAGPEKDSCLLGIAYNLRRFDIDRGLKICSMVQRLDLNTKCKRFVQNGRL